MKISARLLLGGVLLAVCCSLYAGQIPVYATIENQIRTLRTTYNIPTNATFEILDSVNRVCQRCAQLDRRCSQASAQVTTLEERNKLLEQQSELLEQKNARLEQQLSVAQRRLEEQQDDLARTRREKEELSSHAAHVAHREHEAAQRVKLLEQSLLQQQEAGQQPVEPVEDEMFVQDFAQTSTSNQG